ncbi:uncharacterized protein LOC111346873 [Stylophora pistillata]|uniref:uncharacterized protein LOC111346873 n=1 Tax=Stylophora pistillata TaxID=50429 RepID=UPI000C0414B0|nr:uncharacterized protein LOC111346873 [Stylophora pistillata]
MEQTDHTQQVAECILRFFPGFEAFKLPSPSADEEVMKNINRNRNHINSEFFSEIEKFKVLLKSTLTPKRSFNDGELVTGQGLAALVELYVKAINTPGVIPNIQSAWDTFVTDKCSEATHAAMHVYNAIMHSKLSNQVPCDSEDIRKYHETALDQAIGQLEVETIGISSVTIERYLNELMVRSFYILRKHTLFSTLKKKKNSHELLKNSSIVFPSPNLFVRMSEIFANCNGTKFLRFY